MKLWQVVFVYAMGLKTGAFGALFLRSAYRILIKGERP